MREAGLLLRYQMLEQGQVAVADGEEAVGGHRLGAAPLGASLSSQRQNWQSILVCHCTSTAIFFHTPRLSLRDIRGTPAGAENLRRENAR